MNKLTTFATILGIVLLAACGGGGGEGSQNRGPGMHGGPGATMGGGEVATAVPVKLQRVERRSIAHALRANGTLEAENEVDLVARSSGPIIELRAEEGDLVAEGQLLARIDDREAKNQVAVASVAHEEARLAFERARTTFDSGLISQEAYDAAVAQLDSAQAQLASAQLQLDYTAIRAPFAAQVVERHVKLAQHVNNGQTLFRISDFNPLLATIEVPEKDLPRLARGLPARIRVEAFPGHDFRASVLRIRPTVDAATGTVAVTLEVKGEGRLRPGMFASVYVQTEVRDNAVVIPRAALVLDSIGDTVFIREKGVAVRRNVTLGFREEDMVEVLGGIDAGDELVVLGQDGLADGTPVAELEEPGQAPAAVAAAAGPPPEVLEGIRQRMQERGMSDGEIEARIEQIRQGGGMGRPGGGPGAPGGPGAAGGPPGADGELPPRMVERIKNASPEELGQIKERMRSFGMDDARIDQVVAKIRSGEGR